MSRSRVLSVFGDPRRRQSEECAFLADQARSRGEHAEAQALYAQAAVGEEAVAREVPKTMPRTRGLLMRSAIALLCKGHKFAEAVALADLFLTEEIGDSGFRREIEGLRSKCLLKKTG